MNNSQYTSTATLVGAPRNTVPSQLNPGSPGVNFDEPNATAIIPLAPAITPIVASVSVPNTNTNVNQIRVRVIAPNGTVLLDRTSPPNTNKVENFPVEPLPESSTVTVTFTTTDGQPPKNVTISIIACYKPSMATTIVTTSTVPPTITGYTPTLTISSTTSGVTQGSEDKIRDIIKKNVVKCKHNDLN